MTSKGRQAIERALASAPAENEWKTEEKVRFVAGLVERYGSIDYARGVARRYAARAERILAKADWLGASVHREFLSGLVSFVHGRDW